jgi:hypothetical protein
MTNGTRYCFYQRDGWKTIIKWFIAGWILRAARSSDRIADWTLPSSLKRTTDVNSAQLDQIQRFLMEQCSDSEQNAQFLKTSKSLVDFKKRPASTIYIQNISNLRIELPSSSPVFFLPYLNVGLMRATVSDSYHFFGLNSSMNLSKTSSGRMYNVLSGWLRWDLWHIELSYKFMNKMSSLACFTERDVVIQMLKFVAINTCESLTRYGLNRQSHHFIKFPNGQKLTPSQRPSFVPDLDSIWLMFWTRTVDLHAVQTLLRRNARTELRPSFKSWFTNFDCPLNVCDRAIGWPQSLDRFSLFSVLWNFNPSESHADPLAILSEGLTGFWLELPSPAQTTIAVKYSGCVSCFSTQR